MKQRALRHDLAGVLLHLRRLVDLLSQESPRLPVLPQLLVVQLHELRVGRREPVRGHLAKSEGLRRLRVRALGLALVQAEAILAQDVGTIVLLEAGEFVARRDQAGVVHGLGFLVLLCRLVVLRIVQQGLLVETQAASLLALLLLIVTNGFCFRFLSEYGPVVVVVILSSASV